PAVSVIHLLLMLPQPLFDALDVFRAVVAATSRQECNPGTAGTAFAGAGEGSCGAGDMSRNRGTSYRPHDRHDHTTRRRATVKTVALSSPIPSLHRQEARSQGTFPPRTTSAIPRSPEHPAAGADSLSRLATTHALCASSRARAGNGSSSCAALGCRRLWASEESVCPPLRARLLHLEHHPQQAD